MGHGLTCRAPARKDDVFQHLAQYPCRFATTVLPVFSVGLFPGSAGEHTQVLCIVGDAADVLRVREHSVGTSNRDRFATIVTPPLTTGLGGARNGVPERLPALRIWKKMRPSSMAKVWRTGSGDQTCGGCLAFAIYVGKALFFRCHILPELSDQWMLPK